MWYKHLFAVAFIVQYRDNITKLWLELPVFSTCDFTPGLKITISEILLNSLWELPLRLQADEKSSVISRLNPPVFMHKQARKRNIVLPMARCATRAVGCGPSVVSRAPVLSPIVHFR